VSCETKVTTL